MDKKFIQIPVEVRESPIYRFHGRLLDLSQIWHLYQNADGNVYVNGVCIAYYIPYENYIELEKKFFNYRGCNYDR